MGRPRSANSISLFPFLAVLVCTMGALILLLLTTTRHLREEAVQKAGVRRPAPVVVPAPAYFDEEPPPLASIPPDPTIHLGMAQDRPAAMPNVAPEPPVVRAPTPEPVDPNIELRATAARLLALRDEQQKAADARQAALANAKDALKSRAAELAKLAAKRDDLRKKQSLLAQTTEDLEKQRTGLSGQLAKVRDAIRRTREQRSAAPSKYALVPFDRRTGTNRRPIYIEFRDDTIRFMPEGVELGKDDVEGFTLGFNPLLAGAEALVRYWTMKSREAGRGQPPPYVLLIVRPSGVKLYPARVLLEKLSVPHGYELVEEDMPLAFPEPDPAAVAVCREAVQHTLRMRERIEDELAQRGRVPRIIVDGRGTGRLSERGGSGPFPPLGRGRGDAGSDSFPDLPRNGREPLADRPSVGTGTGRGIATLPGGRPGQLGDGPLGEATPGGGMPTVGGSADPDWMDAVRGQPTTMPHVGGESGLGDLVPRAPGLLPPNLAAQQLGTPGTATGESSGGSPFESDGGAAGDDGPSSPPMDGTPAGRRGDRAVASQGTVGTPGVTDGPIGRGPGSGTGGLSSGSSVPNGSPTGSGTTGPGGPTNAGSNRAGAASQPVLDLPWYRRPSLLRDDQPHRRKWGYSDPQGTIGFERDIDVQVAADHIVVGHQMLLIDQKTSREELTQWTLTAVELQTRTWGHAPRNFYWAPTLKFTIAPGGEPHYQALQSPLAQWGLPTTLDRRPPAPAAERR